MFALLLTVTLEPILMGIRVPVKMVSLFRIGPVFPLRLVLMNLANLLIEFSADIIDENNKDIELAVAGGLTSAMIDRLSLSQSRLAALSQSVNNIAEQPQEDAADALAIAICHYHQLALPEELRAKTI